jgi:Phytanoyl-CoA dioxygenase (PhyH)
MPDFKKHLSLSELLAMKNNIEDIQYWRKLCPNATVSNFALDRLKTASVDNAQLLDYQSFLSDEGYFQTAPMLPVAMQQQMLECIETVKLAGFPAMFALVYDVFYEAFNYFDPILKHLLGDDYTMIPNFWVYYIEASNNGKGFEPHRDLEYLNTLDANGNPTVLTLWITVNDSTPLNSCMYVLPKHRDPEYHLAVNDLKQGATQFKLEDVRAVPIAGGCLSAWDQYLYHWGSRSSKHASAPRVSYAMYCQRGDRNPVDDASIDLREGVDFKQRLGLICRGVYRYSYVKSDASQKSPELLAFLENNMKVLKNHVNQFVS